MLVCVAPMVSILKDADRVSQNLVACRKRGTVPRRERGRQRVLVLGEDAFHSQRWPNRAPPIEGSFERRLFRDGARKSVPQGRIELRIVDQRNVTHGLVFGQPHRLSSSARPSTPLLF